MAKVITKNKAKNIHRCGSCQNCGDCCILYVNGGYQRCVFYDLDNPKHCTIYDYRPDVCKDFPRGPFDTQYKSLCGFYFLDDRGEKVDGYMDERTRLRFAKFYSHKGDIGKKRNARPNK